MSSRAVQLKVDVQDDIFSVACSPTDISDKDFDLILYGATGFTGRLAAEYLAQGLAEAPRWAIGGRNETELSVLSAELGAGNPAGGPPVLVADLQDATALRALTARARVVLTFAGPYEKYGAESLVQAALDTCTHYVDITGETFWKAMVLQRFGMAAEARGVALVQSAGLDSLPADLLAMLAAEEVAADGQGGPTEVAVMWRRMNGMASGGTIASGVYSATHHGQFRDPYILAPKADQALPEAALKLFPEAHVHYDMSVVDVPVVIRSMSLRFPGTPVSFSEDQSTSAGEEFSKFVRDPRMLTDPPKQNLRPGEGPPRWVVESGSFSGEARARRASDGRQAGISLEARGDPGYGACAKMSVELALGLAKDSPVAVGYTTPSLALGAGQLKARLARVEGGTFMKFNAAT